MPYHDRESNSAFENLEFTTEASQLCFGMLNPPQVKLYLFQGGEKNDINCASIINQNASNVLVGPLQSDH